MKGANEPEFCVKTVHMGSNLVIIAAAVFSILNFSWPRRWSCESDVIGGRFKTFKPHPLYTCVSNTLHSSKGQRTNNNIHIVSREVRVNEDTSNFPEIFLAFSENGVQVVWPLQPDLTASLWSENGLLPTSLDDCERK